MKELELQKLKYALFSTLNQLTDFFISTWLFMVGVGMVHLEVFTQVPSISFYQSFVVVFTAWQLIPNGVFSLAGTNYILKKKFIEREL